MANGQPRLGIGLPNTLDVPGPTMAQWARRAERRGFTSLGTIDRIAYRTFDSLTSLAVAAGATSTIELFTDILLTPVYPPVWLAKATASLDAMSGGRLTLGLGVGGREDDFTTMGRPMHRRGKLTDDALDLLHRAWAGEPVAGTDQPVGPLPPAKRVRTLIGGNSEAAVERTVRYADGWTSGGGGPALAAPMVQRVRRAWRDAGRHGEPRLCAMVYFGLGDEAASRAALHDYYAFLGEWAAQIADGAVRTPEAVRQIIAAYADIGVHEIMFMPTVGALDEVDRLADAVL